MLFISLFATLDIDAIRVVVEGDLFQKDQILYIDLREEVQGHIAEPGKLPSILQIMLLISNKVLHLKGFGKRMKTLSPTSEKLFCPLYI